jgi:hypothetical protein
MTQTAEAPPGGHRPVGRSTTLSYTVQEERLDPVHLVEIVEAIRPGRRPAPTPRRSPGIGQGRTASGGAAATSDASTSR